MANRYKIVDGSQSCHCCFVSTVVDTTQKVMAGKEPYAPNGEQHYEPVCECFDEEAAKLVCDALNLAEMLRKDRENR